MCAPLPARRRSRTISRYSLCRSIQRPIKLTLNQKLIYMTMELSATPEEVMRAVEALQKFGREQNLSEETVFGLALALEECGSNIVEHGLNGDARQKFRVTMERRGNEIRIELRDSGPKFDLTAFSRPSMP